MLSVVAARGVWKRTLPTITSDAFRALRRGPRGPRCGTTGAADYNPASLNSKEFLDMADLSSPPSDRVYSDSHEWHKIDGDVVTLGLTAFAVDQLTDVTFVEMKAKGTKLKAGDAVGEVESVKSTSDVYSAVAGEVVEVNQAAHDDPSLLNSDPYGKGWLVKVRVADKAGLSTCVDAAAYAKKYLS